MVYRVGILGLKGHQGVVLNSILKIDDVALTAVADDSEEALMRLKKHPAVTSDTKFYKSIFKLLEEEKIDIACVSGTDGERARVFLECMNRGVHVLSEKPLTITHEVEVEELTLDKPVDEFLNFVNAVKGLAECEVPAEDCFRVTEIVLKARESSKIGKPIKL